LCGDCFPKRLVVPTRCFKVFLKFELRKIVWCTHNQIALSLVWLLLLLLLFTLSNDPGKEPIFYLHWCLMTNLSFSSSSARSVVAIVDDVGIVVCYYCYCRIGVLWLLLLYLSCSYWKASSLRKLLKIMLCWCGMYYHIVYFQLLWIDYNFCYCFLVCFLYYFAVWCMIFVRYLTLRWIF
jgi:hypothetical protein